MDEAGEVALKYDAQLALYNAQGKPTFEEPTVDQLTYDTEEGTRPLASYLSLLRIVHTNDGLLNDEKVLLQRGIEHTEKFLAIPENMPVEMANKHHLGSIQTICDSLVARHSITTAIQLVKLLRPNDSLESSLNLPTITHGNLTETNDDFNSLINTLMRSMTNNAGVECMERFKHAGDVKDLEEAILHFNEVLDHTPPGSAERAVCFANLGSAFSSRFAQSGEVKDIDSAIERSSEGISLTPLDSADRPGGLKDLGNSFLSRFKWLGEIKDVDSAIKRCREAINLTPLHSVDCPGYLTNLGNSFLCRFERLGEAKDIDSAIERHQEAVSLAILNNAERPVLLNNLGLALQSRFDRLGKVEDIDLAIKRKSEAVRLSPLDSAV
ncbi:hypothetical protein PILCRDRAFT_11009 [Piloderma croceum F 1598]|uniref:Uncharacterized protein n=1 Tax=Piloderma croceum (strain F 1598) TaxID=765440 RepID=A0A0C3FG48_PILCF|nr:hypothetical protein PILCRDRAFT_11009 [Piloderma croceum F 1598]